MSCICVSYSYLCLVSVSCICVSYLCLVSVSHICVLYMCLISVSCICVSYLCHVLLYVVFHCLFPNIAFPLFTWHCNIVTLSQVYICCHSNKDQICQSNSHFYNFCFPFIFNFLISNENICSLSCYNKQKMMLPYFQEIAKISRHSQKEQHKDIQ